MRTHILALIAVLAGGLAACGSPEPVAPPVQVAPDTGASEDRAAQAAAEGLELRQFDLNRDDRPDVFKYFRIEAPAEGSPGPAKRLVRKEIDINHDGKIDIMLFFDAEGRVSVERTDLDFDGRIDEVAFYENGVLRRKEIDLNYDEKPDVTKHYENDKLVRIESDRVGDGQVDTWEYFVDGELDRIGTDTDRDGKVDDWERRRPAGADAASESEVAQDAAAPTEGESSDKDSE